MEFKDSPKLLSNKGIDITYQIITYLGNGKNDSYCLSKYGVGLQH